MTKGLTPEKGLPNQLLNDGQYLFKTTSALFCGIQGTGRLYKITDQNGLLHFERMDSTYFSGSNFWSINFTLRDTIYSFGGYGFWKRNGLLRRYNWNTHDWVVRKVEREIPSHYEDFIWLDTLRSILYVSPQYARHDGLVSDSAERLKYEHKLFAVEMNSGAVRESQGPVHIMRELLLHSHWGALHITGDNTCELWDIESNKILSADPVIKDRLQKIFTYPESEIFFFIDSTLYFGSIRFDRFDSIPLSKNDFTSSRPLFINDDPTLIFLPSVKWLAFFGGIFLLVGFYWVRFKKGKTGVPEKWVGDSVLSSAETTPVSFRVSSVSDIFTHLEQQLMKSIVQNAQKGRHTSIEEINHILGLSGKNEQVQKKNRNDTIISINQKWCTWQKSEQPLLERIRTDHDKRVFVYSIHPDWISLARSLFESN